MKAQLENCLLILLMDGWLSERNNLIMATSIHTGNKSDLLETTECEVEKKLRSTVLERAINAAVQ
jgi:hypothetical protein